MIRKIFHGLFAFIFPLLLTTGVLLVSTVLVFSTPSKLETALQTSGIYDVAVDSALSHVNEGSDVNEIPLGDPGLQAVIKQTVPPSQLQQTANGVIDSFYEWFNGKTATPEFTIDITKLKTSLAANLATYATQRVGTLPACAKGTSTDDFNPLSAACLPAGITAASAGAGLQDEILKNTDMFKQDTVSINDLKDEQGNGGIEKFKAVPSAFKAYVYGSWAILILAILTGVGIIFLAATRRRGVKAVGITLGVNGLLLAAMGYGASIIVTKLTDSLTKDAGTETIKIHAVKAAHTLAGYVYSWWLWFGIALTIIGVVMVLLQHFLRPKGEKPAKAPKEKEETPKIPPYLEDDEKDKPEPAKTESKAKSSKKISISG